MAYNPPSVMARTYDFKDVIYLPLTSFNTCVMCEGMYRMVITKTFVMKYKTLNNKVNL